MSSTRLFYSPAGTEGLGQGLTCDTRGRWQVSQGDGHRLARVAGRWLAVEEDGSLPGEDRSLGGQSLYIDLVPQGSWAQNARSALPARQWTLVSDYVRQRAGTCEACGGRGALEAHERWIFDETQGLQQLGRLVGLCKACHLATHYGFAVARGWRERADRQLARVAGLMGDALTAHSAHAFAQWRERSQRTWQVDLSILQRAGLSVRGPTGSPCVGRCLAQQDRCQACQRSVAEIAAWQGLSVASQKAIERELAIRWLAA